MMQNKEIKCPYCGNMGDAHTENFRHWFDCWSCGFRTMLKSLSQVTT